MLAGTGLEAFVAVVEEGGISAASRRLSISRPTLSRHLSALEESLGVRLLHRSTRRVVPTPAGEELYRRARRIVAEASEARLAVSRLDGVPRGLLRVTLASGLLLQPMLSRYLAACPEVELEVFSTTRHVDLVAEGFDVAVRAGPHNDPGLVARVLWSDPRTVYASPGYLAAHGTPQTPGDLSRHVCIRGFDRGITPQQRWPLRDGGAVRISGRFTTNDLELAISEAVQGRGLILLPDRIAQPLPLVPVLREQVGDQTTLSVSYPSRRLLDPKVRVFVDMVIEEVNVAVESGLFEDALAFLRLRDPTQS